MREEQQGNPWSLQILDHHKEGRGRTELVSQRTKHLSLHPENEL